MSATIIDSLIVRLGIDAKGAKQQAAPVAKQLNDIEKQGERSTKSVDKLSGSLGKFLALIGSTLAIRAFVEDTVNATAALDRLAKNLNLGAGEITAWGNAAEELGGSAKGLQGSLSMLSREQTNLRVKGESSLLPYFSMLKVNLTDAGLAARPTTKILLDLADAAGQYDRQTAHNIFADMGFDEGTINLLLQGRKELELTLARQKAYGEQVAKFAPEATKLQRELVDTKQGFTLLGLTLLHDAAPALEKVLGWFQSIGNWARENSEFVREFLTVLGVGLGAISVMALPITGTVAAITALAAGIVLLYQDYQTWKRGGDSFIDWQVWKDRIDAVKDGIITLRDELKKMGHEAEQALHSANEVLRKNSTYAKLNDWVRDRKDANALTNFLNEKGKARAADNTTSKILGIRDVNKQVSANQMERYFTEHGINAAEAAGLAANVMSESQGKIDATGDHGNAYGLLQWHKDRQANFKSFAGHDIRDSTIQQQLDFILHELGTTENAAGTRIAGATSAREAGELTSKLYVRPKDVLGEASRRGSMADHLAGIQGASSTVAAAGAPAQSVSKPVDNSSQVTTGDINIYTQATDAQGIAKDMKHGMNFLFTSQANGALF